MWINITFNTTTSTDNNYSRWHNRGITLHYIRIKVNNARHFNHFTITSQFRLQTQQAKERRPRTNYKWDFNLVLKVCREFDNVSSAGKLFHVRAATTGNAWSPIVASRVSGTANAKVDDDRNGAFIHSVRMCVCMYVSTLKQKPLD